MISWRMRRFLYGFKKKGGVLECLNEGCGYTKKSARKGKKTDE